MATSDKTPPTAEQQGIGFGQIERFVKIGSGLLVLIYAAGFFVVSIHHARYGIAMFEFFRARVFAAGLLLVVFLGYPMFAVHLTKFTVRGVKQRRGQILVSVAIFGFMGSGWIFALSPWVSGVQNPWENGPILVSPFHYPAYVFLLWFVGVALFFADFWKDQERFTRVHITVFCMLLTCIVIGFGGSIYGKVLPAWGGGKPVPVIIHFSHKTPFADSLDVSAYMVDETERGYYLIREPEKHHASFIPREAIASVDF